MHPEQIKAELRIAGTTISILADELLVAQATVSQVVHGRSNSRRIKERIASAIGREVDEIWAPKKSLVRTREEIQAQRTAAKAAQHAIN